MEPYQIKTISEIRASEPKLTNLSNQSLIDLYREWSCITASAGWLMPTEAGLKSFNKWATTAPCDLLDDRE